LPAPDPGDADFARKVAFTLGKAWLDHTGVSLGPEVGVSVGFRRSGADPAGIFRRLAFAYDGNDAVFPLTLVGHKCGEVLQQA